MTDCLAQQAEVFKRPIPKLTALFAWHRLVLNGAVIFGTLDLCHVVVLVIMNCDNFSVLNLDIRMWV